MSEKNIKELFIEYYLIYDEEKKNELIKTATIVLDTNVLLNFYRWSKNTAGEFLKILEQIRERIWIPYQVLYEFFQKRLSVIEEKRNKLNEIIKEIEKIIKKLKEQREFKYYNFKEEEEILIKAKKSILDKIEPDLPEKDNDWIFEKIINFFEGKHGQPFPEEEKNEIIEDGKIRYKQKIPPGYKDDSNKFGDLLIWKEIIFYAKKNKKDIIFITDDQKEDWWWLDSQKQKISPRPELIREFYNETAQLFWMYTSQRFLDTIKSTLELPNKEALEKAIKEMKEIDTVIESEYSNYENKLIKKYVENISEQIKRQKNLLEHYELLKNFQNFMNQPTKNFLEQSERVKHQNLLTKSERTNDEEADK